MTFNGFSQTLLSFRETKISLVCILLCLLQTSTMVSSDANTTKCSNIDIDNFDPCADSSRILKVGQPDFGPCGTKLKSLQDTANPPQVSFMNAKQGNNYLLAMVDPDAMSRDNPIYRYVRHWLTNFTTSPQTQGALSDYWSPKPPANTSYHRYIFYLFDISNNTNITLRSTSRTSWNVNQFLVDNNLCKAMVASYQFLAQNDTNPQNTTSIASVPLVQVPNQVLTMAFVAILSLLAPAFL